MTEPSVPPRAGDKMAAMQPVTPEALERIEGIEAYLLQDAMGQFTELCTPHGLIPVEVKEDWRLTVIEMRRRGMSVADDMDDDLIVFGFSARAATKLSPSVPAAVWIEGMKP